MMVHPLPWAGRSLARLGACLIVPSRAPARRRKKAWRNARIARRFHVVWVFLPTQAEPVAGSSAGRELARVRSLASEQILSIVAVWGPLGLIDLERYGFGRRPGGVTAFVAAAASSARPRCAERRPRQRRREGSRDKARRTRPGARAGRTTRPASVVSPGLDVFGHLAPENPVGVAGVEEGERHHDREADEGEELRVHRIRRLPDGDVRRHDVGKEADREAEIAEEKHRDREKEGRVA